MKADPPTDFVSWPNKVKPFGLKNGHGNTCLACLINEFAEVIFIELWNMVSVPQKLGVVIRL